MKISEKKKSKRVQLNPINQRRWRAFKAHRRGFWSLWIFLLLFFVSLFAEFIANDKPVLVYYKSTFYFPILNAYPETTFGGEFQTEAEYRDPFVQELIDDKGFSIWPLIPFADDTINYDLPVPAPAPPSTVNWLGTDDQGRDMVARLIYGFRISVLFGLCLTLISSFIGVSAGALQGYFGGWIDLLGQRFMEIWAGLPVLYLLIILASIVQTNFWWDLGIMFRHILPNAMVSTITFMPFILSGSVTTLTALDFLGFGLPAGSPSLGELLRQGKANLQATWIGISAFCVLSAMLTLLVFIGEAARDALDPRHEAKN